MEPREEEGLLKGSEPASLDSQSQDTLPAFTLRFIRAPQSRPTPASFGVWGLDPQLCPSDSQTDAIGLSDNVFFLRDHGQWKLGRLSQLLE